MPAVIVIIAVVVSVGIWGVASYRVRQELAIEVQKVRVRGEPLNTVELDEYYVAAPDRPDMTTEIRAAFAVCNGSDLKDEARDLPFLWNEALVPADLEPWDQLDVAEAFLAKHQSAFDALFEVAEKDGTSRFPFDLSSGLSTKMDDVQALRNVVKLLSLKTKVDLRRGRTSEAVRNIRTILALARTLDNQPIIISQVARVALDNVALKDLASAIQTGNVIDDDLTILQDALRKIEVESGLKRAFVGERAMGYTCCLAPQLMNNQQISPTREQVEQIISRRPQRLHDAVMILKCNTRIVEASERGLADAMHEAEEVEAELKEIHKNKPRQLFYIMTMLLVPACKSAPQIVARSAVMRDSADAAIGAEMYRRLHGKWPDNLEQLVPEFLPEVPNDPFCGEPLRMISTADEFTVYSVGKDGRDDGGTLSEKHEPDMGFTIFRGPTAER